MRNAPANESADFDQLLYVISHDIRAHVRALKEIPAWIEEDCAEAACLLPDEVQENLVLLRNKAQDLDTTLLALLDYSRIGRAAAERCDLAEITRSALDQLNV